MRGWGGAGPAAPGGRPPPRAAVPRPGRRAGGQTAARARPGPRGWRGSEAVRSSLPRVRTTVWWIHRITVTVGLLLVGAVILLAIWAFMLHDPREDIDLAGWVGPQTAWEGR